MTLADLPEGAAFRDDRPGAPAVWRKGPRHEGRGAPMYRATFAGYDGAPGVPAFMRLAVGHRALAWADAEVVPAEPPPSPVQADLFAPSPLETP